MEEMHATISAFREKNLTAAELAQAFGVKVSTVRVWQRQGIPFQPVGRLRRYDLHAVTKWLREKHQEKSCS